MRKLKPGVSISKDPVSIHQGGIYYPHMFVLAPVRFCIHIRFQLINTQLTLDLKPITAKKPLPKR
jgi:hypothetical protein